MYLGKTVKSRVTKVGDIPTTPHWAIVRYETVTTWSGYDEDRGSSETITAYYVFTTEKEWVEAVLELQNARLKRTYGGSEPEFIAFHVDKFAVPSVNVSVTVGAK